MDTAAEPTAPPPRGLLVGLMVGVAVHATEAFSVMTALPALTRDLGAREAYDAVLVVYLLASIPGLVWAAGATDRVGPAPALARGLSVAALGFLGASVAPSMSVLLVARGLQGFGGGALTTVIYALVRLAVPSADRSRVFATLSLVWGGSAVALPGLFGVVVEYLHWRWVFALGLPAVALTGALVLPALGPFRRAAAGPATPTGGLGRSKEIPGVLLLVAGGVLSLFPTGSLSALPGLAAAGRVEAGLAGAGLGLIAVGLWAVWPAGALSLRPVAPACVAAKALVCGLFFGAESHLPLALTDLHHRSSVFVGAALSVSAWAWSAGAYSHARLLGRLGPRGSGGLGAVLLVTGVAALAAGAALGVVWAAFAGVATGAFGMGFAYTMTSDTALVASPPGAAGRIGMSLGVADAMGSALGVALAGALLRAGAPGEPLASGLTRAGWARAVAAGAAGLRGDGAPPGAALGAGVHWPRACLTRRRTPGRWPVTRCRSSAAGRPASRAFTWR